MTITMIIDRCGVRTEKSLTFDAVPATAGDLRLAWHVASGGFVQVLVAS